MVFPARCCRLRSSPGFEFVVRMNRCAKSVIIDRASQAHLLLS